MSFNVNYVGYQLVYYQQFRLVKYFAQIALIAQRTNFNTNRTEKCAFCGKTFEAIAVLEKCCTN